MSKIMMILAWMEAHQSFSSFVIWPLVSAIVLMLFKPRSPEEYAKMNPRLAGFLMLLSGLGLDPHKVVEGLKRAATGRAIPLDQAQADALLKRSSIKPPAPENKSDSAGS